MTRRQLLKILSMSPVTWVGLRAVQAGNNPTTSTQEQASTLVSLIDHLIPADSLSPSGVEVGVVDSIITLSKEVPNYTDMLELGQKWLEDSSKLKFGKTFENISNFEREKILIAASKEAHMTLPRVFFDRIRKDAMAIYYGDMRSYAGLSINNPIQPIGYPQFSERPDSE